MTEDWKKWIVDDLEKYALRKRAMENISVALQSLQRDMEAIQRVHTDAQQSRNEYSSLEDRMLSCLIQKRELARNLEYVKAWIQTMDAGLAVLSDMERRVLKCFYISPQEGVAGRLSKELALSTATVYRRKDTALKHLAKALYGIGDIWGQA